MLEMQARRFGVPIKVGQRVATVDAETHHQNAVRDEVSCDRSEDSRFRARSNERHHVSRHNGTGKWICDALLLQVKLGEVGDQPLWARMIVASRTNQLRIGVDADDLMAPLVQPRSHPAGPAAGIEDARPGRKHRIHESGFTTEIDASGGHCAEPLDVPLRVVLVSVGNPTCWTAHAPRLVATARAEGG